MTVAADLVRRLRRGRFEEIGDRRGADQAAALLRRLGASVPPGGKRRAELTRREYVNRARAKQGGI